MRAIPEPKLKLSSKRSTPKRERYWAAHGGKPTVKRFKLTGLKRRLTRGSILARVAELGRLSDVAVVKTARREDLVRNLAFAIHQQRLFGALDRLRKSHSMGMFIPSKIETAIQQSALKAQEET